MTTCYEFSLVNGAVKDWLKAHDQTNREYIIVEDIWFSARVHLAKTDKYEEECLIFDVTENGEVVLRTGG